MEVNHLASKFSLENWEHHGFIKKYGLRENEEKVIYVFQNLCFPNHEGGDAKV